MPDTYLNKSRGPYPFCPGCSHGKILDALNAALVRIGPDPSEIVIVTDIGCTGLSDQWFATHAFHGLHGRSVLYGEGLSLVSPDLHIIVLMGDGGAGVGLHHLISAARRNMNLTVLMFNNFNFGMTGGEHSVTSLPGAITSTSRTGNHEVPAKTAETLALNGAPFAARCSAFDSHLTNIIENAIRFKGFSFVEILELCTAYYSQMNHFWKNDINSLLESTELPRMSAIRDDREVYTDIYRQRRIEGYDYKATIKTIEPEFSNSLEKDIVLTLSGSAGQTIQSTAALFAVAAIISGLYVIQKDDYPVTIKTGYSISTLKLSTEPSEYAGSGIPDILFILSKDGLKRSGKLLEQMSGDAIVYTTEQIPEGITEAAIVMADFEILPKKPARTDLPFVMLASWLKRTRIFDINALVKTCEALDDSERAAKSKNLIHISDAGVLGKNNDSEGYCD